MKFLSDIEDPVKRRAMFIACLTKEIKRRGGETPVVVGGEALEIYTQGGYTGDIDITAPKELTEEIFKEWNFVKVKGTYRGEEKYWQGFRHGIPEKEGKG